MSNSENETSCNNLVDGLNVKFNGERYVITDINYKENILSGTCKVTDHLFTDGNYAHFTLTLSVKVICDAIVNFLNLKYAIYFSSIEVTTLLLDKVSSISNFNEVSFLLTEKKHEIKNQNYTGSFSMSFGEDEMIISVSVSCELSKQDGAVQQACIDNYNNHYVGIKDYYIKNQVFTCLPVFKIGNNVCHENISFPMIINAVTNALFLYSSIDLEISSTSRFLFGKKVNYTFLGKYMPSASNKLTIEVIKKNKIKGNVYYKVIVRDEDGSFKFSISYLFIFS